MNQRHIDLQTFRHLLEILAPHRHADEDVVACVERLIREHDRMRLDLAKYSYSVDDARASRRMLAALIVTNGGEQHQMRMSLDSIAAVQGPLPEILTSDDPIRHDTICRVVLKS